MIQSSSLEAGGKVAIKFLNPPVSRWSDADSEFALEYPGKDVTAAGFLAHPEKNPARKTLTVNPKPKMIGTDNLVFIS